MCRGPISMGLAVVILCVPRSLRIHDCPERMIVSTLAVSRLWSRVADTNTGVQQCERFARIDIAPISIEAGGRIEQDGFQSEPPGDQR